MTKALSVARWEYIEKVRSKAFLISLVLMPAIMVAFGVVPGLLATRADTDTKIIGIIDLSGEITAPLSTILTERYTLADGKPNYLIRAITARQDELSMARAREEANGLVSGDQIEGYLIIEPSVESDSTIEYRSKNVGNFRIFERLTTVIREIIVEKKLRAHGVDPVLVKELTRPIELKTIKVNSSGKEEESGFGQVFLTSYVFMMMMFFLVMTSGQLLVRSMLEEKSNRVVEILMSSATARELMVGKIVGLSGLGFTQLAVWGLIGLAITLKLSIVTVPATGLLVLLVYFVLGYLLYAGFFVAAGSPVSTEQEAQQITTYLTLFLVMPIVLAIPVMQDSGSTLVKVLTFIPLFTPTMMALRIPIQMPSVEEILLSSAVLALSVVGVMWAAAKIFRTTILIYGKRPGIRELIRILRTP